MCVRMYCADTMTDYIRNTLFRRTACPGRNQLYAVALSNDVFYDSFTLSPFVKKIKKKIVKL